MAHSKHIVIKCPACGEKFEAEREEEACFISCPECEMQVKISGTHDRRSRSPRRMTPAPSLPARRHEEKVQFGDLASGMAPIDLDRARRRAKKRVEEEELVIDEDEVSTTQHSKTVPASRDHLAGPVPRTSIERRAAKLEERAAKLEERALRLAQMKVERAAAAARMAAVEEKLARQLEAKARAEQEEAREEALAAKAREEAPVVEAEEGAPAVNAEEEEPAAKAEEATPAVKLEEEEPAAKAEEATPAVKLEEEEPAAEAREEVPAAKLEEEEPAAEAREEMHTAKAREKEPKQEGAEEEESPAGGAVAGGEEGLSEEREREPAQGGDEVLMEKVEVRSRGERRRLKQAPIAEIPQPRGQPGAPRYSDLRREVKRDRVTEDLSPTQRFEDRKIAEGSTWRRHQPARVDDPDWETQEREEELPLLPSEKRRLIILWSVVGLLALFGIVAAYEFILTQLGWMGRETPEGEITPVAEALAHRWSQSEMLELAKPAIAGFLGAKSNEEALQYVRRARKVAVYMKKHYLPGSFQPVDFDSLGPAEDCHLVYKEFFVVPVTLADFSSRGVAIEIPQIAAGEWLIDWESWEGYSEMGFAELQVRQPKEPVLIRSFVIQEDYYNFDFPDSDKYISFKMLDRRREEQIWGYLDRDTEDYSLVAGKLAGTTQEASPGEEMWTVRVQFPDQVNNPGKDQVLITEFVTFGWVVRE